MDIHQSNVHQELRENCVKLQRTRRGNNRLEGRWKFHDVTDKEKNEFLLRGNENHMVFPVRKVEFFSRWQMQL